MPEPQSLSELMWAGVAKGMQLPASFPAATVGECVDDRHPAVDGKLLIAYPRFDGCVQERWLASMQGLRVRAGDRVILVRPGNWPEPVIVGVLCGVDEETEPRMRSGPTVRLDEHDTLQVAGADGSPLVEISRGQSGPVVHLLQADVEIRTPGKLRISARSIEMESRQGDVQIAARDDVVVRGSMIRLN